MPRDYAEGKPVPEPLPDGAATEAKQDVQETTLNAIQSAIEGTLTVTGPLTDVQLRASAVPVDGSGVTQPISAISLPLPTGAATESTLNTVQSILTDVWDDAGNQLRTTATIDPAGLSTEAKQDDTITELQAIKAAAQIMDDWDESDRAKVNPIVGQAGVSAGAGAVDATTQRTTLASDDPLVAKVATAANQAPGSDGAVTSEAVSDTAVELLASSASRRGGILFNDGNGVARISFGATTPTASVGIPLAPGDYMPFEFSGQIRAIRQDSTDTTIAVQEITT